MSKNPRRPASAKPPAKAGGSAARITTSRSVTTTVSQTSVVPSSSRASVAKKKQPKVSTPPKKKIKASDMPPLSTVHGQRKSVVETEMEKLRKKNIRRIAPAGEDLKKIREIIRNAAPDLTVQEFVGTISPYTGDNGEILRGVMADELSAFRKLAIKVYETMTQDVSDVLTNEHAQLINYYNEQRNNFRNKMMRAIDEIHEICPDFDFDAYFMDKPGYIAKKFPLPEEYEIDPDEMETRKRQVTYHRLQWLRSEGDRLHAENKELQKRLNELKKMQQEELRMAAEAEQQALQRREQLEATEAEMEEQLENLNQSIEKSIVQHEKAVAKKKPSTGAVKKQVKAKKSTSGTKWNVKTASDIETRVAKETTDAEISKLHGGAEAQPKRSRQKFKRPPAQGRDRSPFHFSPIKSPQGAAAAPKERSPFHYSPPKTPPKGKRQPQRQASPFHYSPPRTPPPVEVETTKVESTTVVTEETPKRAAIPARRKVTGPRDSWGGF